MTKYVGARFGNLARRTRRARRRRPVSVMLPTTDESLRWYSRLGQSCSLPAIVNCWRCPEQYRFGSYDWHLRTSRKHSWSWSERLNGEHLPQPDPSV